MFQTFVSPYRYQLKESLTKLFQSYAPDTHTISYLDARQVTIQDILSEAATVSLDGLRKVIVIQQPYFLMRESKEKIEELQDYTSFDQALASPDPYVDIIFSIEGELDERKAYVKALKKFPFTKLEPLKIYQWNSLLYPLLTSIGLTLDQGKLQYVIDSTYPDLDRCRLELEKLRQYDAKPTLADVKLLIRPKLEDNVFELSNALLSENIKKALSIVSDFKQMKEEPIYLINLLGKQFILFAQASYLYGKNEDYVSISKTLHVHEYRVKVLLDNAKKFPLKRIQSIIKALANLDLSIKKGEVDRYFALDYFIATFKTLTF
jgi:DNA polymerase-3 subunit delta